MSETNFNFITGLTQGAYIYDKSHSLLAPDGCKGVEANIGRNGANLTISFLSMNRAVLSEKLLRSIQEHIPSFEGEVLVIDNGSSESELNYLKALCNTLSYKIRIVELGQNFGVAGGRNRTIPYVQTEWIMYLDNDIYFLTNPLPIFQNELAILGSHFMSLPLLEPDGKMLFAKGGHLYVSYEDNELYIGAGSACSQKEVRDKYGAPFLSTFLFGGSCILKRVTFEKAGGYDEGMFVGFEDIDFSIRLFQNGYKVGSSGFCALVHDHPKPTSDSDRDYEKERFSRNLLHKSALHLEAKHGFKIWSDAVDHWLESRLKELAIGQSSFVHKDDLLEYKSKSHKKPKIALILDTDFWAFGNISRQLQRNLADRFEFLVIPMDVISNINQVFMMTKDCDIVHFFWREHLTLIGTPYHRSYVESLGLDYGDFEKKFIFSKKISTSVYDHLLLETEELEQRKDIFSNLIAGYTVGSEKLNIIYSDINGYPKPTSVVEDGVDIKLFIPKCLNRFRNISNRDLVIGWVGNSSWASELEDFKGVNTILKPTILKLQSEGIKVKTFFADRQEAFIPHDKMPDYYSKIDVLICTSKIEGTPNPVLEAMACGVPVISTDVGVVPQVFGDLQKRFILKERSIQALSDAIKSLRDDHDLLYRLSTENLQSIQRWDWIGQANRFGDYFQQLLDA
jgi:glycosyltransferase involved in cell wall biosynthesis/GT2 family glycosyltransferase